MSQSYPCSALINGKCKNGFPVSPGCSPWQATDGRWQGGLPYCMNERLCALMFPETGRPGIGLVPEEFINAAQPKG